MKKWIPHLALALLVGLAIPFLPHLLTQGVETDLSGRLGLAGGVTAGTFAVLFVAGILTSLTPCVYPLIPITVSVFGARQAQHRGRSALLSGTYVAGIALTYSALGLFAALSGRAFGSALSSPPVIALLAFFLLALAASMFGAFDIALPFSVQQKLDSMKGAGFAHAFGMGLVAGIIAAPCTGPVLAGVLAFVATKGSAVLGFWMLFTYAVGMGVLFFVLGATSLRLPRSGAWMETVKSVLGVALVAAAVSLLLPMLPKPQRLPWPSPTIAALAGALAFAAVLLGALRLSFHGAAREKALKAASLVVLLGAVGLRFGWLGAPKASASEMAGIPWLHDELAAIAQSRATGKPLLVDFSADWCAACKELDAHTWSDPRVAREAERFVPLKIDATDEAVMDHVQKDYAVPGLPTVLMMACNNPQPQCSVPQDGPGRITGFLPPPEMLERMRRVQ